MRNTYRIPIGTAIAVLLLAGAADLAATPLGSVFSYQGVLQLGGSQVNSSADFKFTLKDSFGNEVGSPVTVSNVTVEDGRFTVELDFGAGAFNGEARWLDIDVRTPHDPNDLMAFTTLSPPQPLHATPYALKTLGVDSHSVDAADGNPVDALFVDNAGNVGIGTTQPDNTLHVMKGSAGAVSGHVHSALVVENNISTYVSILSPATGTRGILFGEPGNSSDGGILYNSGGSDGFRFRTNGGVNRMSIDGAGNVGIGTTSPSAKLEIGGTPGADGIMFPDGSLQTTAFGGSTNADGHSLDAADGSPVDVVFVDNAGSVGIGTTNLSPNTALHVAGKFVADLDILTLGKVTAFGDIGGVDIEASGDISALGNIEADADVIALGNIVSSADITATGEMTCAVFNITSDKNAKESFAAVDPRQILAKVVDMPITEWQYKRNPEVRHIGPVAQDFHAAFSVGRDAKHIASVDSDGVALAAIKGLHELLEERDAQISVLQGQLAELAARMNRLDGAGESASRDQVTEVGNHEE